MNLEKVVGVYVVSWPGDDGPTDAIGITNSHEWVEVFEPDIREWGTEATAWDWAREPWDIDRLVEQYPMLAERITEEAVRVWGEAWQSVQERRR